MKVGDRIRVQKYICGVPAYTEDYTVESFRYSLGVFMSGEDRKAQNFTPLCKLYEPAPDAKKGYICNYGDYYDSYVQSFMNLPREDQTNE